MISIYSANKEILDDFDNYAEKEMKSENLYNHIEPLKFEQFQDYTFFLPKV